MDTSVLLIGLGLVALLVAFGYLVDLRELKIRPGTRSRVASVVFGFIGFALVVIGVYRVFSPAGEEQSAEPAATATSTTTAPTSAAQAGAISSPGPGSTVTVEQPVSGTADLPVGQDLWVLVEIGNGYHPQPGPIPVTADGTWQATVFVGTAGDSGKQFTLALAATDAAGTAEFVAYLDRGAQTGSYPGLPPQDLPEGWALLDSVTVVRG
jgi:hypothetical protein